MEKKNTVLLTVIAVATLLVAVVGATFAYFTATNTDATDGAAGNTQIKTQVEAGAAGIILHGTAIEGSKNTIYPGTMNYVGTDIYASFEDGADTTTNYNIDYTLSGKVVLDKAMEATGSDIEWKLYEIEAATAPTTDIITCSDVEAYVPAGDGATAVEGSKTQKCTDNLAALVATNGAKVVDSGTIAAGTPSDTVSFEGTVVTAGNHKYYYLVAEFKEAGTDQNVDATGKQLTLSIDSVVSKGSSVAGA